MVWIKIDDTLPSDPKTLNLMAIMNWDLDQTLGKMNRFWLWCAGNAPDGDLRGFSNSVLAAAVGLNPAQGDRFVNAMLTCGRKREGIHEPGFLDKEPFFMVHAWDRWKSDPVRLKSNRSGTERRKPDECPTNVRQTSEKEKREAPLSASSLPPIPPISSSVSSPEERKEEDSAAQNAAALDSTKPVKSKAKPVPYWSALIDHIKRKWEYKKRPHGRFAPTVQDFALLRGKALVYDAFNLMALYDEFIVGTDPFWAKNGHKIWVFCGSIDYLVELPGWKAKADKYRADHLRPETEEQAENVKKLNGIMSKIGSSPVLSIADARKKTAHLGDPGL